MTSEGTKQADYWKSDGGDGYISRNRSDSLHASNLALFAKALERLSPSPFTCLELGANIGMNFRALSALLPNFDYTGVEVNKRAVTELAKNPCKAVHSSIEDYQVTQKFDLVLTKGVLIHLNPESLPSTYAKLYEASSKWILIAEYYAPEPSAVTYRGREDLLFKRDFAGEMLDMFPALKMHDYGFAYHRGGFPQDDINWFVLRKED